ncbi:Transcriptional regulator, MerR family [Candidatus Sulfotelmatomonas gaucii]|uniref:Transcriptional regulator, MerR family n=1 Tax=Candidatus Sulfuritelmatomonas gaucii TaxID=2043161 RepID=A0A2N9L3L5_9BACT|nr:Transcriptional regulator, MerR family [Candidatus Sulfotelmatomonas gaucii]
MFTVTKLARRCGLSRTALLYYESIGLMTSPLRSVGNYRCYGEADLRRLLQIRAYRDAGLKLEDIRALLGANADSRASDAAKVLRKRLIELDAEIRTLREHQHAIFKLLEHKMLGKAKMITKEKWVSIMQGCGFSKEQMHRWHAEFERSAPEEHQEFLEFLHIPPEEIKSIRKQSRSGA